MITPRCMCYVVMRHVGMYSDYEAYAERVFSSRDEAESYISSMKFEVDYPIDLHFEYVGAGLATVPRFRISAFMHPRLQDDGSYAVRYPQIYHSIYLEQNLDETYWTIEEVYYGA